MYHAHFATALLIKAIYGPSIPAWPIMFGSSLLDIVGGLDAAIGLDTIIPDSTKRPYMYSRFEVIDWEHSVLMMVAWACVFGWVGCHYLAGFSKEASMLGAASSIIHWLMDVVVVEPTAFTLYPHGGYHFGLGLYERLPILSWVLECFLCAVLGGAAYRITKSRTGADISKALLLQAALSLLMSPWTSPLLVVAQLYEKGLLGTYTGLVQGAGFWTAYIVPATLFTKILDRAEEDAAAQKKGE